MPSDSLAGAPRQCNKASGLLTLGSDAGPGAGRKVAVATGPPPGPAVVTFRPHLPQRRRGAGRWPQATEQLVGRRRTKDKEKRNVRAERTAGSTAWTIAMIRRPQEHLRLALVGLLAAVAIAVLAWAPTADAAACPNESLRAGSSAQLPDCRAYEMVSPADMNGNGVEQTYAVRGDGDALLYGTLNIVGDEAKSSITGRSPAPILIFWGLISRWMIGGWRVWR